MRILTTLHNIAELFLLLIEIEGRIRKKKVIDLRWALAYLVVSALWVLAAVIFFLFGIYQYLAAQLSPGASSMLVSILAVMLALFFVYLAKWESK